MSQRRFWQAVVLLSLVMLLELGYLFTRPLSPAEINQRADQLVARVTRIKNKSLTTCYAKAYLPACERIRAAHDDVISMINEARHRNDPSKGITSTKAILFMSQLVDEFEAEAIASLQAFERSTHLSTR